MSALRDKLDPDTSPTIVQAMRLHAKGSKTQASMDPTVSVALSNEYSAGVETHETGFEKTGL